VAQIYTSGTTGHPKGVQLSNRSFFSLAKEMEAHGDKWVGWTDSTVSLVCVPTFHVAGVWQLVRGLALGSTCVMTRSFAPAHVLKLIPRYGVSLTGMVPSMIQIILAEPGCATTDFSSLQTIVYGGAPVSTSLLKRAIAVFGCDFFQIYGLTETGNMAVCLRAEDHCEADDHKLLSAGKPLPGVEVKILDERGAVVVPGVFGQIAIKSPAHMVGYWNRAEDTQKTLIEDWIMTGDVGHMDAQGFVYVCDRTKDMIISAGENIYPAEIENVIRSHDGIADVAVIGVPHDLWGEAVKAIIVPRPGRQVLPTEIIRYTRAHLAEFKVPRSVDVVDALPRNASGKVLKIKLREPYWQGRERRVN
jgi:acyl-CoA synthetase (AMP-forming)/AMP-acid ligase II